MPPRKATRGAAATRKAGRLPSPAPTPASLPSAASGSRTPGKAAPTTDSPLSSPAGSPASSASTEPLVDAAPALASRRPSPSKKRRLAEPVPAPDESGEDDGEGASTSDEDGPPLTKSYGGLVAKPSPKRPRGRSGRSPSDSSLSSAGASDDGRPAAHAPQASTSAARPSLLPPPRAPAGDDGSELSALSEDDDEGARIVAPAKTAPATYGRASEVARGKRRRVSASPLPELLPQRSPSLPNGDLAPVSQPRRPSLEELSALATVAADVEAIADEPMADEPLADEEAMEVDAPPAPVKVPRIDFDEAPEVADEPEDEVGDGDDDYTEAEAQARVHEPSDAGFLRRRADAIEHLMRIEVELARLRDRLFAERMEECRREKVALRDGSHLDYIQLNDLLEQRRALKLGHADRLLQAAEDDAAIRLAAAERQAWYRWNEERAELRREMAQDVTRSRFALLRDKRIQDRLPDMFEAAHPGPEREAMLYATFEARRKAGPVDLSVLNDHDLAELSWSLRRPPGVAHDDLPEPNWVQADLERMGLRDPQRLADGSLAYSAPPPITPYSASSLKAPLSGRMALSTGSSGITPTSAPTHAHSHLHLGPLASQQQQQSPHQLLGPAFPSSAAMALPWGEDVHVPLRHRHALPSANSGGVHAHRPSLDAHMAASALRQHGGPDPPPHSMGGSMPPRPAEHVPSPLTVKLGHAAPRAALGISMVGAGDMQQSAQVVPPATAGTT